MHHQTTTNNNKKQRANNLEHFTSHSPNDTPTYRGAVVAFTFGISAIHQNRNVRIIITDRSGAQSQVLGEPNMKAWLKMYTAR